MKTFILTLAHHGKRLDHILKILEVENGLRGCRRLCESGLARLNGRPGRAAEKGRSGDRLEVYSPPCLAAQTGLAEDGVAGLSQERRPTEAEQGNFFGNGVYSKALPEVAADFGALIFIYKPSGMHSVSLAGKSDCDSLENYLPRIAPGFRLLTRLDFPTSGLVAAVNNDAMARKWRESETSGTCLKFYCALLEGRLEREMPVENSLETAGRQRSVVLTRRDPDFTRHTRFYPLAWLAAEDVSRFVGEYAQIGGPANIFTLAGCLIRRGARHQIRAHAAGLGHPLAGDALYGAQTTMPIVLHHGRIISPFGQARCAAPVEFFLPSPAREALQIFWNSDK